MTLTRLFPVLVLAAAAAAPPYFYDLGPAKVDVSKYPAAQQEAYPLFEKTCAACHTLARAINCPYVTDQDWQRYLLRMHRRTQQTGTPEITMEVQKKLVDFLVYDAGIRKVAQRASFDALTLRLKARYERLKSGAKPVKPKAKSKPKAKTAEPAEFK